MLAMQNCDDMPSFDRPSFIIAAPRSGSSLLFEQLCHVAVDIWSIGGESHEIFDTVLGHRPFEPGFDSVRASSGEATPERTAWTIRLFTQRLRSEVYGKYGDLLANHRPKQVRVLDKLPKNAFRVAFLNASFPDARFIFLYREPRGNVASLIEAWHESKRIGRFVTYEHLSGSHFNRWCFVLPPGWRSVLTRTVPEIAAFQWKTANSYALNDLLKLPRERWCAATYDDLVLRPERVLRRICDFMGCAFDSRSIMWARQGLRRSRTVVTPPSPHKWSRYEMELDALLPSLLDTADRVERCAFGDATC